MKQKFLSYITLLAALLVGGVNSAAAQATTTIGNTDNTTAWWTVFSDPYTIAPNKTLTVKFTNHSSKANNWNNFAVVLTQDVDWGTEDSEYLVLRADNYGWQYGLNTGGESSHDWFNYLSSNFNWDTFKDDLDGATVTLTIRRTLFNVTVRADIKTAADKDYYEELQLPCGDGLQNLRAYLTVDNAHIVIDNEATTITDSNLMVGSEDNTTAWWSAFSDYFKILQNQSLTLEFDNYSDKAANYHNWLLVITSDANRDADGYTEYAVIRGDNYVWGTYGNSNDNKDKYVLTSNFNWDTFKDDMDGAHVKMTITRSGDRITARADITTRTSAQYFEQLIVDVADNSANPIRVFLTTEAGHLVLNTTLATIGEYGWATFSSDYALDFSKATTGLEAYMITGYEGTTVTTSNVTGTVPAGTGLLLKGDEGSYSIPVVGSSATDVSSNKLVPGADAVVAAESGKTKYALSSADGKAVFKKIDSYSPTIAKGKAYLLFDEVVAAPTLSFDFNNPTGISEKVMVNSEKFANTPVYNLAGQRVAQPKKGLYIVNGKKIVK